MTRKKIHSIFIIITSFIIISIISLYLLSKIQEKDKSNYGYSGSTEEGMERLNKYIEQHPKNTEAMIDLARKYLNIREYEKAGDLLIQIIQTDPNHEMALYTYGRLFVEQFKFSEAIEQFEKVVAINENPIASLQYLTHIYLVFDRQKALEYAKKATDIQRQRYEQGEEDVNIPFFEEWENIVAEFDTKFEI